MRPEIITVHDIHKAIEENGVEIYANTVVQEMGGDYYFVDADFLTEEPKPEPNSAGYYTPHFVVKKIFIPDDSGGEYRWWRYRVVPIPLKFAYFIVETLRLKAQFSRLGVRNIDEPVKMAVYLLPGSTFMGKAIETLTEIPAEMNPVVVERL